MFRLNKLLNYLLENNSIENVSIHISCKFIIFTFQAYSRFWTHFQLAEMILFESTKIVNGQSGKCPKTQSQLGIQRHASHVPKSR